MSDLPAGYGLGSEVAGVEVASMSDWFESGSGREVDVAAVFDSKVPEQLVALVEGGALVSLSKTSDGGALGITVTLDGRYKREYFRHSEEAVEWLEGAVRAVELAAESPSASREPGSRSRRPARGR